MPVFSANLTMLWQEISDPYERFRAAAAAGFSRVERLFAHDLDPLRIKELLEELSLELVLFDPYPGDWEAGERGLLALPGRESELRETVLAPKYNFGAPSVFATHVGTDGTLELTHDHGTDGRGLDLERSQHVLDYLHKVWRRPINLQTVDADGKETVLTRE